MIRYTISSCLAAAVYREHDRAAVHAQIRFTQLNAGLAREIHSYDHTGSARRHFGHPRAHDWPETDRSVGPADNRG